MKAYTKKLENIHVHLRVDNRTTVAQVNKMGGTRSIQLLEITQDLWNYSLSKNIILTAEHLPGVDNKIADWESRNFTDTSC